MSGYIGVKAPGVSSGTEYKKKFSITGTTTSLTGLTYNTGRVHLFHNGVRLVDGTDYTATDGTNITLTVAAESGDEIVVVSQASFQLSDHYTKTEADSAFLTPTGDASGLTNLPAGVGGANGVIFNDNVKAQFGAGNDLEIYHNGGDSIIADTGTGDLYIRGSNDIRLQSATGSDTYAHFQESGYAKLYHNNSEKLATTSTGVNVTGTVTSTGLIANVPTNTGLTINSTDVSAIQFNVANGSQKNWGFASTLTAAGDFGLYQSNSNGGNPVTAGTARLYIDSSGDVMVGQTAGDVGGGHLTSGIKLDSSGYIDTAKASGFAIRANRQTTEGDVLAINYNGSPIGALGSADTYNFVVESKFTDKNIEFKVNNGGSAATVAQFYGSTGAKSFGSFESFSGGYNVYAGAGSAASYGIRIDGAGTGSAGILQVVNGYGQVGSIRVNGASTQFNTSSDYRLKTDVQPMTGASARVQALNPVNFGWIADGNRTDGFLAHEAQEVVPEAITGIKDAMKDEPYEVTPAVLDDDGNVTTEAVMGTRTIPDHQSIDQSKLVPLLTAALQEALTEIASLKTRVEALEA
jgi:hypothetical protein